MGCPSKLAVRKNRGCLVSLLPPPDARLGNDPRTNLRFPHNGKLNVWRAKAISTQRNKKKLQIQEKQFMFEHCVSDQVHSHNVKNLNRTPCGVGTKDLPASPEDPSPNAQPRCTKQTARPCTCQSHRHIDGKYLLIPVVAVELSSPRPQPPTLEGAMSHSAVNLGSVVVLQGRTRSYTVAHWRARLRVLKVLKKRTLAKHPSKVWSLVRSLHVSARFAAHTWTRRAARTYSNTKDSCRGTQVGVAASGKNTPTDPVPVVIIGMGDCRSGDKQ